MLRLRAERAYQARAFAFNAAGCLPGAAEASFSSGPLPPLVRDYSVRASSQPSEVLFMMDWRSEITSGSRSSADYRARWLPAR